MPLATIVGLNGCGKDTIAKELVQRRPEVVVLSGSRIMMRALGIQVGIEAGSEATREMYATLEQTPLETKAELRRTAFRNALLEFKQTGKTGILLGHLVVAHPSHQTEDEPQLQKELENWYPEVFDKFVHVHSPLEQLMRRREHDSRVGVRERGQLALSHLAIQHTASAIEWQALAALVNEPSRILEVENHDGKLHQSVEQIERFLFTE